SVLVIPLLREDRAIGVLIVARYEVRPFTEAEIALMETFADQAVIAIENARLFEELERRTQELASALVQQTALGEGLRVITASPTNLQTVLDTIASAAVRFTGSGGGVVQQAIDQQFQIIGLHGSVPAVEARRTGLKPTPVSIGSLSGRAFLEARTVHVP